MKVAAHSLHDTLSVTPNARVKDPREVLAQPITEPSRHPAYAPPVGVCIAEVSKATGRAFVASRAALAAMHRGVPPEPRAQPLKPALSTFVAALSLGTDMGIAQDRLVLELRAQYPDGRALGRALPQLRRALGHLPRENVDRIEAYLDRYGLTLHRMSGAGSRGGLDRTQFRQRVRELSGADLASAQLCTNHPVLRALEGVTDPDDQAWAYAEFRKRTAHAGIAHTSLVRALDTRFAALAPKHEVQLTRVRKAAQNLRASDFSNDSKTALLSSLREWLSPLQRGEAPKRQELDAIFAARQSIERELKIALAQAKSPADRTRILEHVRSLREPTQGPGLATYFSQLDAYVDRATLSRRARRSMHRGLRRIDARVGAGTLSAPEAKRARARLYAGATATHAAIALSHTKAEYGSLVTHFSTVLGIAESAAILARSDDRDAQEARADEQRREEEELLENRTLEELLVTIADAANDSSNAQAALAVALAAASPEALADVLAELAQISARRVTR